MINDLKAKRFNPRKFRHNIVSEDLYLRWKEQTGRTETWEEFRNAWYAIAETMIDIIVEEPDGIRLAKGMGDVYIGYVPSMVHRPIDYQASLKHGKVIRHENWNTNRKPGKIIYGVSERKYIYRLAGWWAFSACRNFKKRVVQAFNDFPARYKNSIEKRLGI